MQLTKDSVECLKPFTILRKRFQSARVTVSQKKNGRATYVNDYINCRGYIFLIIRWLINSIIHMRKCAVKKSFSRVSQTVHNIAVLIKLSKWFETLWWIFCWYFRDFCACMMPRRLAASITRSTREFRVINADQFFFNWQIIFVLKSPQQLLRLFIPKPYFRHGER